MMNILLKILLASSIIANTHSHGMDKPGPHGGLIQMPGAFHTEVVSNTDGSLSVYLLDINFKNPVVNNSSVELKFEQDEKKEKENTFTCLPMNNEYFLCRPKNKTNLDKGKFRVIVQRETLKGEAIYDLPLTKSH
jgi:hypothetical protein